MNIQPKGPFIYALYDPLEPERFRYIGMSLNNPNRPLAHKNDAIRAEKSSTSLKINWIMKLAAEGRSYAVKILAVFEDDVESSIVFDAERKYIHDALIDGHPLTNIRPGGGGISSGRPRKPTLSRLSVKLMTAVTISEADKIYQDANRADLSVSSYLRHKLLEQLATSISQ